MAASNILSADARPTKRFFIENLTRDLSLEDAILDLVDNAVDSFIRTRDLDVSPALLTAHAKQTPVRVTITLSTEEFRIEDSCGGIDIEHARFNVFRFGRTSGSYGGYLGVYGIGLKRAVFKLGSNISITSRTATSGFEVTLDADEWSDDEENWTFPLRETASARSLDEAGTTIVVRKLKPEVQMRVNDGALLKRLGDAISTTYALFLPGYLGITLNGVRIDPQPIPLAETSALPSNSRTLYIDGVSVTMVTGLQQRVNDEWRADRAGWYVLCNGRVVVSADRTELTGWGLGGPTFVSKHRGFIGIAFFFSSKPADLPWTTTKRDLNLESPIYQRARKEMTVLARPVLSFLDSFYPTDAAEKSLARDVVATLERVDLGQVVSRGTQTFPTTLPSAPGGRSTVKVQFDAERADVDRVRKHVGKPSLAAGAVGRLTFEHYLQTECPQ